MFCECVLPKLNIRGHKFKRKQSTVHWNAWSEEREMGISVITF